VATILSKAEEELVKTPEFRALAEWKEGRRLYTCEVRQHFINWKLLALESTPSFTEDNFLSLVSFQAGL
jgi:hypothetical protein